VPAYIKNKNHPLAEFVYNNEYNIFTVSQTDDASPSDIGQMILFAGICKFMRKIGIRQRNFVDLYYELFCDKRYPKTNTVFRNAYTYTTNLQITSRLNIPLYGVDEDVLCKPDSYFFAMLMDDRMFLDELSDCIHHPVRYPLIPDIINRIRNSWTA